MILFWLLNVHMKVNSYLFLFPLFWRKESGIAGADTMWAYMASQKSTDWCSYDQQYKLPNSTSDKYAAHKLP